MKKNQLLLTLFLLGFAASALFADVKINLKRKSMTNGEVTFVTGKQVRFLHRAFPDCDLLSRIEPVTFYSSGKQWFSVPYPDGEPEILTENGLRGFRISRKMPFGECSVKILMPEKGPFVLLRFSYRNLAARSTVSGSIPSIDFPEEFVRFAVNGQERAASQTLQNGKNQLKKISSYAAFSTEEATQPSVMMIIPDLMLLDFTAGAAIRAGGCRRGYGWFPGANVRHSDFAENDLDRNAEVFMDVILAAISPEKTFSETSRAAMDFYKSFKTAGK